MVSQPRYYWCFGLNSALVGGAVLCTVEYSALTLSSTQYMLVAPTPQLWQPKMSPDLDSYPLGEKLPLVKNHCSGQHTILNFSHLEGVSTSAKQLKDIVVCIVNGETGPCPKAALDCFSLVSRHLPSLINNCLNLPIGTQGRSWRLNEGCFL